MGDGPCNLECNRTKKKVPKPKIQEFIGTVKILLVDSPADVYTQKKFDAGLISLAYLMMGAAVMNVLCFTLKFQLVLFMNLHIVLCTLGYQLCIPCGMLIINKIAGASNVTRPLGRRIEHACLQLFGFGLGFAGTGLALLQKVWDDQNFNTIHSVCGMAAGGFGGVAILLGPLSCFKKKNWVKIIHMSFGIMCLIFSSMAFISGVHRYCIFFWLPVKHVGIFLYIFCFFYTAVITKYVLMSMLKKYGE